MPKQNSDDIIMISVWSDNEANWSSLREDEIEVNRAEWLAASEEEKYEIVRQGLAANGHFNYGFTEPEELQ